MWFLAKHWLQRQRLSAHVLSNRQTKSEDGDGKAKNA